MTLEIYLGNWGTIKCFNAEHREYLIAARAYSDSRAATQSWIGDWLYPEMEEKYMSAERSAKAKCDTLWNAIPGKENLRKRH